MTPTKSQQAQEYAEKKNKALRKAWFEYRFGEIRDGDDWENDPVKPSDNFEKGFMAGYTACEQSMWRSVEEGLPEDGDCLTLIRYDSRLIMEIAPWRGGLYQGGYTLSAYTGKASVTHWMPTPILPKLPDTNTEKK